MTTVQFILLLLFNILTSFIISIIISNRIKRSIDTSNKSSNTKPIIPKPIKRGLYRSFATKTSNGERINYTAEVQILDETIKSYKIKVLDITFYQSQHKSDFFESVKKLIDNSWIDIIDIEVIQNQNKERRDKLHKIIN